MSSDASGIPRNPRGYDVLNWGDGDGFVRATVAAERMNLPVEEVERLVREWVLEAASRATPSTCGRRASASPPSATTAREPPARLRPLRRRAPVDGRTLLRA